MDFISLALAGLKIIKWIMARIDKEEIRADERRKILAKELMILREEAVIDDEIEEEVRNTPIEDLRKELTQ